MLDFFHWRSIKTTVTYCTSYLGRLFGLQAFRDTITYGASCLGRRIAPAQILVTLLENSGFPESQIESYNCRAPVYNLRLPVKPGAVVCPRTAEEVSLAVTAAHKGGFHVKAVSGGHSFANYAYGADGALVVNMKYFQKFEMDKTTWRATVGGGTLLGDVTKRMHDNGKRAISHGTCPQVGIGGHATIGGLGPTSRQWGTTLDHVVEVEAVTADGQILRANKNQNADLFLGIIFIHVPPKLLPQGFDQTSLLHQAFRGAGGSFGIVTEFVFETHPEPGESVQYRFNFNFGYPNLRKTFKSWQRFISQPSLDRKFASLVSISHSSAVISGTFYGTMAEYEAFGFNKAFGDEKIDITTSVGDVIGEVEHWLETEILQMFGGQPMSFYAKSLTVPEGKPLNDDVVDAMFDYIEHTKKGTPFWGIIANVQAGKTNDIALDATAYAHRDTLWMLQTYMIDLNPFDKTFDPQITKFADGLNDLILNKAPYLGQHGSGALYYPGYVDPAVDKKLYWGSNYTRLLEIKQKWDPDNVFADLQSVGAGLEK